MNNELSITTLFQLHYDSIPSDTRHHQHHVHHQQQPMIIFGNYCYYIYNNNLCYINIRYKICKHVVMMNDISCMTYYNKEQQLFIVLTTDGIILIIKVYSNNIDYIIELTNLPTLYNNNSYDMDDFNNDPNNNQNYNKKTNNININNPYKFQLSPPTTTATTTTNQASLLYDIDRQLLVVQFNHALILYNIYEISEDIVLKLIISSSTVDDMTPFQDITPIKDITRVNNDITIIKNIEKYQIWGNNDAIYIVISNSSNYLSLLALKRQLINNNYEWITTASTPVETSIPVKSSSGDRHSNDKDNDVHCDNDVGNEETQPNDGDDNNNHASDHHHHLYEYYSHSMFEEIYTRHKSWITAISRRSSSKNNNVYDQHHHHHHRSSSSIHDYDNDHINVNRKYNNVRNNYRRCIEATGDSQGMIIFWECDFNDHHHQQQQQQHRQQQQHDVHSNNHDHENDDSNYNKNNNTISADVNNYDYKQSKLKYIMKNKDIFRNNSITDIFHDRMHHHDDRDNSSNDDDDDDDASSIWWIGDTSNVITSIHVLIRRKEIVVLKRLVLFGGCYSSLSNNNSSSSSYNNSNNENAPDGINDYVDSNDSARSIGFPTQIEWISSMYHDNPADDHHDHHNHDDVGDDNDQDDDDDQDDQDDDDDKHENKKSGYHLRRKKKNIKHNKNHSIGILRAYCVTSGMMVECLLNENIESISKLWLGINDIPAVDPLVLNPGNRSITSAAVNVFNNVVIDLCTILPKLNLIITTAINSKYLYISNIITGDTIDMIYMDENHCKCISSYDDNNNNFRRYDHNDGNDNIGRSGNYGKNDVNHDSEDDIINNVSGSNLNNNNNSRKNRKKLIYDSYVGIGYANGYFTLIKLTYTTYHNDYDNNYNNHYHRDNHYTKKKHQYHNQQYRNKKHTTTITSDAIISFDILDTLTSKSLNDHGELITEIRNNNVMHDDDDDDCNDDDNSVASEESLDLSINIDNNDNNDNNNSNNQVVDISFWSEPYTTTTYTTTTNNYSHNHHDKYNRYNNYDGSSSNSGTIKYKIEMKHKFSPLPITDILFSNNGGNYIAIVYARKLIFIYNHHDNSRKAIMKIKFDDYFQDIQVIDNFLNDDPKNNKMYIIDKNNSKNTASIDANTNLTTINSSNNTHNHDVNKIESMILSIQTKKVIRIINALIGNILHEIKLFNISDFAIIRSNGWRINRNNSDDNDGHHVNDDDDGRSSRNNDNIHGFFVTNDMNIYIYSTTYDDHNNTNHSHIDVANSDYSAEYKHHHQQQEQQQQQQQQQHYRYYQYHYHHQNKTNLSKNNILDSLVKGLNIRNYYTSSSSPSLTSPASSSSHAPLVIIWSFRKLIILHIKYKSRLNKIDVIKLTEYHVKSEYIRIVYASALPCNSNNDMMMMMMRRNKRYKVMVVLSNGHMFVLTI